MAAVSPLVTDPYTQIYDRIWEYLESQSGFTDLVPLRNRIKYSGTFRRPDKMGERRQAADYPEVSVTPDGGTVALSGTSTGVLASQAYLIQVFTGSMLQDERLSPLVWAINRAMAQADSEDLGLSNADANGFVLRLVIENYQDRNFTGDASQEQWVNVMRVRVDMQLTRDQYLLSSSSSSAAVAESSSSSEALSSSSSSSAAASSSSSSSSAFSPLDLPLIQVWRDSSLGPITAAGGNVSLWENRNDTTPSLDMIQNSAGAQPSTQAETIGGLNAVLFDGSEYMDTASGVDIDTGAMTFFMVFRQHDFGFTFNQGIYTVTNSASLQGGWFFETATGSNIRVRYRDSGGSTQITVIDGAFTSGEDRLLVARFTNGKQEYWVDDGVGVVKKTETTFGGTPVANTLGIARRFDTNSAPIVTAGEILTASALSDADINTTANYLADRFGVSWSGI